MSVSAFSDPYKSAVVKAALPKTPTYSGTYKGYVLSGITLSSPTLLEVDYYDGYGFAGTSLEIPLQSDPLRPFAN